MNREIEFRAWNYLNNKMYYDVRVGGFNGETVPTVWDKKRGWVNLWADNKDGGVIMQYTGLEDKNGKKIFEGDVIENTTGRIMVVEKVFGSSGYRFIWSKIGFDKKYATWKDEITILGNKFENPELLSED